MLTHAYRPVTDANKTGVEQYTYDTDPNNNLLFPGKPERPAIIEALEDALNFLNSAPNGDEDEPGGSANDG